MVFGIVAAYFLAVVVVFLHPLGFSGVASGTAYLITVSLFYLSFLGMAIPYLRSHRVLWARLITIGFSLLVIRHVGRILLSVENFQPFDPSRSYVLSFIHLQRLTTVGDVVGLVLIVFGSMSVPLAHDTYPNKELRFKLDNKQQYVKRARNPFIEVLFFAMTLNIYLWFWIYRSMKEVKSLLGDKFSLRYSQRSPGHAHPSRCRRRPG